MMKLNKTTLLSTIAVFLVVVFFVQPTLPGLPPKRYQAIDWTRHKVNAFLSKHKFGYDKKHVDNPAPLVKKVQEYENAAKNNAQLVGAKVDVLINAIKIRLEQQHNLSKQDLDGLIDTIQLSLRQLERTGQWTGDKVGQAIDTVQQQMAHKKTITEAFWNSLRNEVTLQFLGTYHHPSLLQRIFSTTSWKSTTLGTTSSLDQWLAHVQDNLLDLKVLNERQLQTVMDQLHQTITKKNMINNLASTKWYNHLYGRLQRKGKLTEKQMDEIKDTLEREISSYKAFVSNGIIDKTVDQSKRWLGNIHDLVETAKLFLDDWLDTLMAWII